MHWVTVKGKNPPSAVYEQPTKKVCCSDLYEQPVEGAELGCMTSLSNLQQSSKGNRENVILSGQIFSLFVTRDACFRLYA